MKQGLPDEVGSILHIGRTGPLLSASLTGEGPVRGSGLLQKERPEREEHPATQHPRPGQNGCQQGVVPPRSCVRGAQTPALGSSEQVSSRCGERPSPHFFTNSMWLQVREGRGEHDAAWSLLCLQAVGARTAQGMEQRLCQAPQSFCGSQTRASHEVTARHEHMWGLQVLEVWGPIDGEP